MATTEQFSLRWNNFHSNLTAGFHDLLEAAEMVDVTLAVEGHFLQAHKIVLSICSPYFKQMFKANPCKHPIVILKDVGHEHMKDILEFMYMGEVNVLRENLSSFLRTAEVLQVKGLTGDDSSDTSSRKDDDKLDGFADTEEESDLIQFGQLVDSDAELSTPYAPSPSTVALLNPQTLNVVAGGGKRQTAKNSARSSSSLSKRIKSETSQTSKSPSKQTFESDQFNSNVTTNVGEEEYLIDAGSIPVKTERIVDGVEDVKDKAMFENNVMCSAASGDANPADQGQMTDVKSTIKHTYQCEKCAKKFSRRDHLRTHEKNIHGEDAGPFVCVICSQLYKNTESLRKHLAKFHFPKMNEINPKVEVKA